MIDQEEGVNIVARWDVIVIGNSSPAENVKVFNVSQPLLYLLLFSFTIMRKTMLISRFFVQTVLENVKRQVGRYTRNGVDYIQTSNSRIYLKLPKTFTVNIKAYLPKESEISA